jgi:hypothetical protein
MVAGKSTGISQTARCYSMLATVITPEQIQKSNIILQHTFIQTNITL